MTPRRGRIQRISRDTVLLAAGLVFLAHEVFIHVGPERPTIIMMGVGLCGLPMVLRVDERRANGRNGNGKEEGRRLMRESIEDERRQRDRGLPRDPFLRLAQRPAAGGAHGG